MAKTTRLTQQDLQIYPSQRQVLAVEQNTEAAAKEAVEAAILRQQLPPAEV